MRIDRHEVCLSPTVLQEIPMAPPVLSRTRRDLVEATGRLWQLFSLPRSTGQIYGLLYLSPSAMSLDEIARQLSVSKASASTGTATRTPVKSCLTVSSS